MVGESNQNVFLIQIEASSFAEFEISEFEISRVDCMFMYQFNIFIQAFPISVFPFFYIHTKYVLAQSDFFTTVHAIRGILKHSYTLYVISLCYILIQIVCYFFMLHTDIPIHEWALTCY